MPETRSWAHLEQPKFSPFPSANVTQTSANRDGESPADARQGAPLPPFEFCQQRLLKPSYTYLEKCLQLRLMWKEKPSLLENNLCRWDLTGERSSMHSGALCVVRNNTRFLNCLWFFFFFEKSWIVFSLVNVTAVLIHNTPLLDNSFAFLYFYGWHWHQYSGEIVIQRNSCNIKFLYSLKGQASKWALIFSLLSLRGQAWGMGMNQHAFHTIRDLFQYMLISSYANEGSR